MSEQVAVIVCSGTGPWRVAHVNCPWCKELRRCLTSLVFSGWCGSDYKCGTCGTFWSSEQDGPLKTSEPDREKNIALVASVPDPTCWDCHDSGWTGESPVDMGHPCACPEGEIQARVEQETGAHEKGVAHKTDFCRLCPPPAPATQEEKSRE